MPVAQVLEALGAGLRPGASRVLSVGKARGRVLAAALHASGSLPATATALRAGWAVVSSDLIGASAYSPVPLGTEPAWAEVDEPLPDGADAVLSADAVTFTGGFAEAVLSVPPGEGVRQAGVDAMEGAVLRRVGERMRAVDVAAALAAGITECHVRTCAVCLVREGAAADLLARLAGKGGAADIMRRSSDSGVAGAAAVGADLVVVMVDGSSLGIERAGAGDAVPCRVAMRPGEGVTYSVVRGCPVVFVPDRVDAALAAALMLIGPLIERRLGAVAPTPAYAGRLTRKISSTVGFDELALLHAIPEGLEPVAVGDLSLAAMTAADAWLAVAADSEGFAEGTAVRAFALE